MPASIKAYYRDYNFIAGLSTPAEQARLLRSTRPLAPPQGKAAPSERLQKISEALARVERQVSATDPGIDLSAQRREAGQQYDKVLELQRIGRREADLIVRARACDIDPQGRALLVAKYEGAAGDERKLQPPAEGDLRLARGSFCRDLIYYWTQIEGEWRVQDFHAIFVDATVQSEAQPSNSAAAPVGGDE